MSDDQYFKCLNTNVGTFCKKIVLFGVYDSRKDLRRGRLYRARTRYHVPLPPMTKGLLESNSFCADFFYTCSRLQYAFNQTCPDSPSIPAHAANPHGRNALPAPPSPRSSHPLLHLKITAHPPRNPYPSPIKTPPNIPQPTPSFPSLPHLRHKSPLPLHRPRNPPSNPIHLPDPRPPDHLPFPQPPHNRRPRTRRAGRYRPHPFRGVHADHVQPRRFLSRRRGIF